MAGEQAGGFDLNNVWATLKEEIAESGALWTPEYSNAVIERIWGPDTQVLPPLPDVESMALEDLRKEVRELRSKDKSQKAVIMGYKHLALDLLQDVQVSGGHASSDKSLYRELAVKLLEEVQKFEHKANVLIRTLHETAYGLSADAPEAEADKQLPVDTE